VADCPFCKYCICFEGGNFGCDWLGMEFLDCAVAKWVGLPFGGMAVEAVGGWKVQPMSNVYYDPTPPSPTSSITLVRYPIKKINDRIYNYFTKWKK